MSLTDRRLAGLFQTGAEDYHERVRRFVRLFAMRENRDVSYRPPTDVLALPSQWGHVFTGTGGREAPRLRIAETFVALPRRVDRRHPTSHRHKEVPEVGCSLQLDPATQHVYSIPR